MYRVRISENIYFTKIHILKDEHHIISSIKYDIFSKEKTVLIRNLAT